MIEFAKITGEVEGHRLQVKMPTGESFFSPLLVCGNSATIPSKKWIQENKSKFLAVITYEGTQFHDPMIIGFYPVKGADPKSYNTLEKTIDILQKLVEQLIKAKVNTQIGPQPFMADTLQVFTQVNSELKNVRLLISEDSI